MSRVRPSLLAVVAASFLLITLEAIGASAWAASDSPLPPLAGLNEEIVLSGTVVNGNRLELNRFTDPRPAALLLAEVTRIWSQRPAPIQRSSVQGWTILTQLADDSVETFEVNPIALAGGTRGRRTRWRKGGTGSDAADGWLEQVLPAGSRVLDRIGNEDGSRRLTTLVASTPAGPEAALQALSANLATIGFTVQQRIVSPVRGIGVARFFLRGSEEIAVTVSEHAGNRALVIHYGWQTP